VKVKTLLETVEEERLAEKDLAGAVVIVNCGD
jgi:hypothetical protein